MVLWRCSFFSIFKGTPSWISWRVSNLLSSKVGTLRASQRSKSLKALPSLSLNSQNFLQYLALILLCKTQDGVPLITKKNSYPVSRPMSIYVFEPIFKPPKVFVGHSIKCYFRQHFLPKYCNCNSSGIVFLTSSPLLSGFVMT